MDWFPDWSGETCAVLGCGPSASQEQAERLKGKARVIAVNRAWQLAPWADVLYACDPKWWGQEAKGYGRHALREFGGLMVSQWNVTKQGKREEGCERINLVELRRVEDIVTECGVIGGGNGSGFQAVNLAVHFGVSRILLLGFDAHAADRRLHWHKDHPHGMGNPSEATFAKWQTAFGNGAATLRRLGVEVINCTPGSKLDMFPMMDVDEALCPAPAS